MCGVRNSSVAQLPNSIEFTPDAMPQKSQQWANWYQSPAPASYNSQGANYSPDDRMPGTDMTQGEWDQLRELMRKAEQAGKVNELMTVHRKEVKNAPMNKNWGPAVDDDWQECQEDVQAQQQPVKPPPPPPGNLMHMGPLPGYASASGDSGCQWKAPPTVPPLVLNSVQAGKGSGKGKGYQNYPYDPRDDPWVEGKETIEEVKPNASTKPVLEIFGKVDQSNAAVTAQKAADAAAKRAAEAAAGFPKGPPVVFGPKDMTAQSEGPINSAAALGSEKAVQEESNQQSAKGAGKSKNSSGQSAKQARISEEPVEVHEVGNSSNKISDTGAMTDGSKRRHEAVDENLDEGETDEDSFSYISETGDSPPLFPVSPAGLPQTFRWSNDWKTIHIDYEGGDFSIPKPAWISDSHHWSCTKLKMGKYKDNPVSYHTFVQRVFEKSPDECRYAKKMIGQFKKKLTPTPRTQGPDFAAFLMHMRVDAFLNAGYVFDREFEWR